jgi:hypothetical protein
MIDYEYPVLCTIGWDTYAKSQPGLEIRHTGETPAMKEHAKLSFLSSLITALLAALDLPDLYAPQYT